MEPQFSVFLFSKYSQACKNLFDRIANSGIDFDKEVGSKLQLLCIDNEKVRRRVQDHKKLEITVVPCILSIFQNGVVEKHEADHAFSWIDNLIQKIKLSQPINQHMNPNMPMMNPNMNPNMPMMNQPMNPNMNPNMSQSMPQPINQNMPQPMSQPMPQPMNQNMHQPINQNMHQNIPIQPKGKNRMMRREPIHIDPEEEEESVQVPKKVPSRMKKITKNPDIPEQTTDLNLDDDLPEENTDRHKTLPQPKRIRDVESGDYIEDESFFADEAVDNRREPSNVLRKKSERKQSVDPNNIANKAKSIAQGREDIEIEMNSTAKRPMDVRRL